MSTLTKYIGDIMGYIGPYEEAETYPGSVSRRCPNINKAKNDLSYSPEIDWKDAVKKTVEWYLKNEDWCDSIRKSRYKGQRLGIVNK